MARDELKAKFARFQLGLDAEIQALPFQFNSIQFNHLSTENVLSKATNQSVSQSINQSIHKSNEK